MAVFYVRSTDGSDADNGSTWALAKATLAGAFAACAAGDTIYVSHVHAETQASAMTLTSPGTAAAPVRVICGNDGAAPPTTIAATATVTTTGTSSTITWAGFAYIYGIIFQAGSTTNPIHSFISASPWWFKFDTCSLRINGTGSSARFNFGNASANSDDQGIELVNTTLSFGGTGQGIVVRCRFRWTNTTSAILGTVPTTLFLTPSAGNSGPAEILGVDLSALGSGTNVVDIGQGNLSSYYFQDCKLGASVSLTTGSVGGQGGTSVVAVNCDSGNTNYKYTKQVYQGTITQDIATFRSGGASDGTTPVSRKMVSTANAQYFAPLESDPIVVWNDTISPTAITVTIAVITDNVTLTDAEAWLRVEYPGTSSFPLSATIRDRSTNILTAAQNQTTDTSTWTNSLGTPVKQQLSVNFTATGKGPIYVYIALAKATTTMYFDPFPILT